MSETARTPAFLEELGASVRRLLVQMAAFSAAVVAALLIAGQAAKILGFLVGAAVSVIYLLLVIFRVRRSAAMGQREAVSYMRTGWLVRLSFIVLALVWSLQVPAINFLSVVFGLLTLQIVLMLNGFYLVIRRFAAKTPQGKE